MRRLNIGKVLMPLVCIALAASACGGHGSRVDNSSAAAEGDTTLDLAVSPGSSAAAALRTVQGHVYDKTSDSAPVPLAGATIKLKDKATRGSQLTSAGDGAYSEAVRLPSTYTYQVSETKYGYFYGYNPSTGTYSYHYGPHQVTVTKTADNVLTLQVEAANHYAADKTYNLRRQGNVITTDFSLEAISVVVPYDGACKINDELFQSVNGGCLDVKTGVTWSIKSPKRLNFRKAIGYCDATPGLRLPTIQEINRLTRTSAWVTHFNFDVQAGFWSSTLATGGQSIWGGELSTGNHRQASGSTALEVVCVKK